MTWQRKKQSVISRSNAEVKYRVMVQTACELTWRKAFVVELDFSHDRLIPMMCDN